MIKPHLETVEDRILPSAASAAMLPVVSVASPPAAPSVAAVISFVSSALDQESHLLAAAQQELSSLYTTLTQELSQEAAIFRLELYQILGISPNSQNPALGGAGQTINNTGTIKSGSGSGSGAELTAQDNDPTPGPGKIKPFSGGGGGGGGGGTDASVSGKVWLDSNGDGLLNNLELGFSGITVDLCGPSGVMDVTTTDPNGNFQFNFEAQPAPNNNYGILVQFPPGDMATQGGGDSQITAGGYSKAFYTLNPGQGVYIVAGLRSMQVTTVQDDANARIQNQTTLRDAIQTGNNGPPASAVTFSLNQAGTTINLQKALDPINKSYDIVAPENTTITVNGGGNANNPYRIFTINAGVTSTISGLTIERGFVQNDNGGGILNNGNLTLLNDDVSSNQAASTLNGGYGGGIYNADGAKLTVQGGFISVNTACVGGVPHEKWARG